MKIRLRVPRAGRRGLPKQGASRPRQGRSPAGPRSRRRWLLYLLGAASVLVLLTSAVATYYYFSFANLIDARLRGERERSLPRVYARPVELRRGHALSQTDVIGRLNDLGYAQRPQADSRGQFSVLRNTVTVMPREGPYGGTPVRVSFPALRPGRQAAPVGITAIEIDGAGRTDRVELDAPLLSALITSGPREKRRHVALATIPKVMQQAVIAIEDQRFYSHPGVNPLRLMAAALSNMFGLGPTTGNSTITQQLARMFFFADEFNQELRAGTRGRSLSSFLRYAQGGLMSIVLERRASKNEILELYLNDVYLGQRGSFGIHGVAEAARIFFGKDVANLSLSEAALIAGVIQSPASRSPFTNAKRAIERRNIVLRAMAREGYVSEDRATRASREPLQVMARAVDNEAPYFVDWVGQQLGDRVTGQPGSLDIYTTIDLNMQRAAIDAVRRGLTQVDAMLKGRRRRQPQTAQAALIAVDPRTGEVLAMVGGRSYNQSQYNRAVAARRQPGSVFKPFVYLAAFEYAADEGRSDLTPATITIDEPATFEVNGRVWEPKNYDDYDGPVTWRRALAMSRNVGTVRVGELVGFDRVAALWRRVGVGTPPQGYPSITLGVFELTPFEVAQAYTLFTNQGAVRPLRAIDRVVAGGRRQPPAGGKLKRVARPAPTFLVTNMMRSVLSEGTGQGARRAGFALDAAGKSGTTNDLRDAWFVGFTPELLTVVWVGYDDNQPLGLSGSRAALPIWTDFMKAALAGRPSVSFAAPEDITWVDIDPSTGKLASPGCARTLSESFIIGTEPTEYCLMHQGED